MRSAHAQVGVNLDLGVSSFASEPRVVPRLAPCAGLDLEVRAIQVLRCDYVAASTIVFGAECKCGELQELVLSRGYLVELSLMRRDEAARLSRQGCLKMPTSPQADIDARDFSFTYRAGQTANGARSRVRVLSALPRPSGMGRTRCGAALIPVGPVVSRVC